MTLYMSDHLINPWALGSVRTCVCCISFICSCIQSVTIVPSTTLSCIRAIIVELNHSIPPQKCTLIVKSETTATPDSIEEDAVQIASSLPHRETPQLAALDETALCVE